MSNEFQFSMTGDFSGRWLNANKERFHVDVDYIVFDNETIQYWIIEWDEENQCIATRKVDYEQKLSDAKMKFMNPDQIRLSFKGIKKVITNGKVSPPEEHVFELDYMRLLPTKSSISKSRIELSQYQAEWNNETTVIEFNTILDHPEVLEMVKASGYKGRRIILEKMDATLLICHLNDDRLEWVLPIKEIDDIQARVYGFPGEPREIVMKRI